jgi:3'-phosphoadenosine 5'-phosphosulfate sulfotransferase (PAPS reductase)/FAD synthetase
MATDHPICWSYGGGVQSVAIAVLVRNGALPVPDLAVIADTGRERQTTWDYLHDVLQPYLNPAGLKIQVAPHTLARVDMYAANGLTLMPAYTAQGRLPAFCSGEWKRDVCERWLRQKGVKACDMWIGYSLDEQRRAKGDHRPWLHNVYPLLEKRVTRAMCVRLIESAGLRVPHKSRCWMCPHQTAEEWQEVRENPEEWAAAVALEKAVNENDPESGGLFLFNGRVPLEMADFSVPDAFPLFPACEGASCWT